MKQPIPFPLVLVKVIKEEKGRVFMECTEKKPDILKSKSLKSLIKGSLVILGLFIVLYFGIDILVLLFSKKFEYKLDILIIILASPIVVFLIALFCFFLFVRFRRRSF